MQTQIGGRFFQEYVSSLKVSIGPKEHTAEMNGDSPCASSTHATCASESERSSLSTASVFVGLFDALDAELRVFEAIEHGDFDMSFTALQVLLHSSDTKANRICHRVAQGFQTTNETAETRQLLCKVGKGLRIIQRYVGLAASMRSKLEQRAIVASRMFEECNSSLASAAIAAFPESSRTTLGDRQVVMPPRRTRSTSEDDALRGCRTGSATWPSAAPRVAIPSIERRTPSSASAAVYTPRRNFSKNDDVNFWTEKRNLRSPRNPLEEPANAKHSPGRLASSPISTLLSPSLTPSVPMPRAGLPSWLSARARHHPVPSSAGSTIGTRATLVQTTTGSLREAREAREHVRQRASSATSRHVRHVANTLSTWPQTRPTTYI